LSGRATAAADGPNFTDDVLPILRTHCVNCHRPGKTRAGLDLTTVEMIEKGGSSGASVQPGIAENSILFRAMAHISDEEPMPPEKDKLSTATLAVIKQWIEGGLNASSSGVAKKATSTLDIAIDTATPELVGHYADNVRLEILPTPSFHP
jgi:hypothetical protein